MDYINADFKPFQGTTIWLPKVIAVVGKLNFLMTWYYFSPARNLDYSNLKT